jgi:hypothetical protein
MNLQAQQRLWDERGYERTSNNSKNKGQQPFRTPFLYPLHSFPFPSP